MSNIYTNKNKNVANANGLTEFNGFYDNVYREPFNNGFAFIFVTKPLLFIDPNRPNSSKDYSKRMAYLNMTRDPYFAQFLAKESMNDMDLQIVKMLSYNTEYRISNFLPMFTNECKSFDGADLSIGSGSFFSTKQGLEIPLPTHLTESEKASMLNLEVVEDSNLSFSKLLGLWVRYMANVGDGTFDANPEMIAANMLDYTCSIYYMVLEPDGRTLKFWSKYTGCWPMSVPQSAMKFEKGNSDLANLSIQFNYAFKEDMSPKILEDFNRISLKLEESCGKMELDENSEYTPILESPLLNLNKMENNDTTSASKAVIESGDHDPVVLVNEGSISGALVDITSTKFELIFGSSGYRSRLLDGILDREGDEYTSTGYWDADE